MPCMQDPRPLPNVDVGINVSHYVQGEAQHCEHPCSCCGGLPARGELSQILHAHVLTGLDDVHIPFESSRLDCMGSVCVRGGGNVVSWLAYI